LGWRDRVGEVSYFINGSVTDNNNKVTKLTGNNPITAGQLNRVGYPINSYFGLEYAGRIQDQETAAQYALLVPGSNINMPAGNQMIPGINMYKDLNGDGMLTNASANEYTLGKTDANGNKIANGDVKYLGSSNPRYVFAVNVGADYKGFDFSLVVQGVGKRDIYRRSDWSVPFGTIWQGHADWWVGKTWTPENPNAELPILTTASNRGFGGFNAYNYQMSDWSLQNGAYVRLKNIVLGYTIPQSISRRAKIERFRIYVSGNDIWEITKVDDNWDPEQSSSVSGGAQRYPFYRLYTVGVNVTF
jgi:hypothetical protein